MRVGEINTIPYKPYRLDPSNHTIKIVPIAEITVETTRS
jgi:hypothetical protein